RCPMPRSYHLPALLVALALLAVPCLPAAGEKKGRPDTLDGTKALTMTGDIASELVDGVDRFLLREIEAAEKDRENFFKRDYSSYTRYALSLEPNRKRLAHILGVRDPRASFKAPELAGTLDEPAVVGKGANCEVVAVRWPAFGDVHGE